MKNRSGSMTVRLSLGVIVVFLFVLLASVTVMHAQDEFDEKGAVRIPWDEFRKLLELDKDEFILSWSEFQLILQQTGHKHAPPFQLRDEKVVLTREQFKRLLNQMKPPMDTDIHPPADYLLTKGVYKGSISAGSAKFSAAYNLEIFERQRNQYLKIPFFPVNIALKRALFDGKQALVVLEGNRHTLTTLETGRHQIEIDFSLIAVDKPGPRTVTFPIPSTAVTILELDIPYKNIDVEILNAQELEISEKGNLTHVSALLSPSNSITIRWHKRLREVEKGPAKVYAESLNLLSIDDDALKVTASITLSILQNTVSSMVLKIPAGYNILDVSGSGIEDWREVEAKGASFLEVLFAYPKKGNFAFSVTAEKILSDSSAVFDFAGFAVQDSVRDKGFLGIELKSASEVTLSGSEGLDKLDVSELPTALITRSQKPLLLGFKYLHHPFSLVLDIKKHKELPVIGTVIDSASGVTLFTQDGKLVHRIVYLVRNTSKQFLELELPQDSQIWSVFVGGEPAKPRLSGTKILIPLNRSSSGAAGLEAFDVELIYFQKAEGFNILGSKNGMFPVPDIIISQMLWSIYIPEDFRVVFFGGTVEKEKTARGLRPLLGGKGRVLSYFRPQSATPEEDKDEKERIFLEASKAKDQFSAGLALSEEQLAQQIENEARFSRRVEDIQSGNSPAGPGILPIRIQIPATGQLFRFAKTIVNQESLTLQFSYMSGSMLWAIGMTALVSALILTFLMRRKIMGLFRNPHRNIHG
jgi:hypothetical protein